MSGPSQISLGDAYITPRVTPETAAQIACRQELQELLAYAKRKGWN